MIKRKIASPQIFKLKNLLENMKIHYDSIYLFGSRAKGTNNRNSDYDFFIILNGIQTPQEIRDMRIKLKIRMKEMFPNKSFDILSRNLDDFNFYKNTVNTIDNTVYEEGVKL